MSEPVRDPQAHTYCSDLASVCSQSKLNHSPAKRQSCKPHNGRQEKERIHLLIPEVLRKKLCEYQVVK